MSRPRGPVGSTMASGLALLLLLSHPVLAGESISRPMRACVTSQGLCISAQIPELMTRDLVERLESGFSVRLVTWLSVQETDPPHRRITRSMEVTVRYLVWDEIFLLESTPPLPSRRIARERQELESMLTRVRNLPIPFPMAPVPERLRIELRILVDPTDREEERRLREWSVESAGKGGGGGLVDFVYRRVYDFGRGSEIRELRWICPVAVVETE